MLIFDPKRHPEQTMVLEKPTEHCYTGFEHGMENFPALNYRDGNHTPHWCKPWHKGTGTCDAIYNIAHGSLAVRVSEVQEGKQSGREAWITLPKEAVDALRVILAGRLP